MTCMPDGPPGYSMDHGHAWGSLNDRRMRALELKIPPVGVFLLAGAAMWGVARLLPAADVDLPARLFIVVVLVIASGAIAVAGILAFRRHETTVDPTQPGKATSLVVGGVYRHTRNPMYLSLALLLLAWAAYLANIVTLLVIPAFIAYMHRFQIIPEERALLEKFGDSYTRYAGRVRRWL